MRILYKFCAEGPEISRVFFGLKALGALDSSGKESSVSLLQICHSGLKIRVSPHPRLGMPGGSRKMRD